MRKMGLAVLLLLARLCAAQSYGSIPADFVWNNNNGQAAGTTMTLPIMTAGSQSSTCTIGTNCTWQAGGEGNGNNALISNFSVAAFQDTCSNLGPVTLNNSSTTFPAQSFNYNSAKFDAVNSAQAGLTLPSGITQLSGLMCAMTPPFSGSGSDWDLWDFWANTGDFSVVQINDTACGSPASLANYGVRFEHGHPTQHPTGANMCVHLVPQQTYVFAHHYNYQTAESDLSVYLPNGTLVGSITFTTTQTASTASYISFGNGESNSSSTPYYFNWMLLNWKTAPTNMFWAQTDPWTGVLAPGRGASWANNVGVTGGIPSGTYTQCTNAACAAVTSAGTSVTATQIQTAFTGAPANTYVQLPAGTLSNVTSLSLSGNNNVAVRGAGANQTIINGNVTLGPGGGFGQNLTTVNSGSDTLQGSNTVTLASVANLTVGKFIAFDQLGSGNVGVTDNGGLLEIGTGTGYTGTATSPGTTGPYSQDGETNSIRVTGSCTSSNPVGCFWQQQYVVVTSCNGVTSPGANCAGSNVVVGFNPPLAMSNWSTALSMSAWWPTTQNQFVGIEDVQVNCAGISANCVEMQNVSNSWTKGVAALDSNQAHVDLNVGTRNTIDNSYLWLTQNHTTGSYGVQVTSGSSFLVENNIFHGVASPVVFNGGASLGVVAFNYGVNNYYQPAGGPGYNQNFHGAHAAGDDMVLFEGNIANWIAGDNVHGTGNLNAFFRNYFSGPLPACWGSGTYPGSATFQACSNALNAVQLLSYHRFYNFIGNVWGTTGVNTTLYGTTANNAWVVGLAYGNGGPPSDPPTQATAMFWNNADSATGFGSPVTNCSGVMGGSTYLSLPASQQLLYAPCPSSTALPASFYYTAQPSWWPSGKPWPPIGPDVTGGNLLHCTSGTFNRGWVTNGSQCSGGTSATLNNGLINSNPALDCAISMGMDPYGSVGQLTGFNESTCYAPSGGGGGPFTLQVTVAGAGTVSDSNGVILNCASGGGTCSGSTSGPDTLTEATPPGWIFQLWGGACSGNSPTCTLNITANTSVTAAFAQLRALAPTCANNCGGTFTGSAVISVGNQNVSPTVMCYTTNGSTPVSNGQGTGCSTGTGLSGANSNITVSSSETLNIIAGVNGEIDSTVLTEVFTIKAAAPTCTSNCGGSYAGSTTSAFANSNTGTTGACYTFGSSPPAPASNGSGTGCSTGTFVTGSTFSIAISATGTLDVIAGVSGKADSSLLTESYTLTALAPSCSPSSGQSSTQVTVTCSNPNSGTTLMCYTEDGSTPTTNGSGTACNNGTSLSGAVNTISISSSVSTLKVVAGAASQTDSAVQSYGAYKIAPLAAAPACNPGTGLYYSGQSASCTDSSGGSVMCYTLDGSTPGTNGGTGCASGTLYTTSIAVKDALTLKVIAGGTAYIDGPVSSFTYSSPITHIADAITDITSSSSNALTFSYTALAQNDAVVFALECTPTTGNVTSLSLTSPGWTITTVGSPVSISNNSWAETFGAIAPNTSAATFTATFAGVTNCGTLAVAAVGEFSGNVIGGGTSTFNAAAEFGAVSSTCNQSAASVTPPLDNEGIWFACIDTSTGASLPYLTGATDGVGNSTGWKTMLGGATTPQPPVFVSSSGNSLVLGVAINWGLHAAAPGFVFAQLENRP